MYLGIQAVRKSARYATTLILLIAACSSAAFAKSIPLTIDRVHDWSDYMVLADVLDTTRGHGPDQFALVDISDCYRMSGRCRLHGKRRIYLFDTSLEHNGISPGSKYVFFLNRCKGDLLAMTTPTASAPATGGANTIPSGYFGLAANISYADLRAKMESLKGTIHAYGSGGFQCLH